MSAVALRTQRVGDMGWAIQQQAELYAEEFRYGPAFEAHVVRSFGPYVERFDAARDRLWVAERRGERVGCIAVHHDPEHPGWAKLRWYFVETEARGHGAGRMLLDAALAFAREVGYDGVHLWTVSDLEGARRQYERAGFRLAFEDGKPCAWAPWGREQRWELRLR